MATNEVGEGDHSALPDAIGRAVTSAPGNDVENDVAGEVTDHGVLQRGSPKVRGGRVATASA